MRKILAVFAALAVISGIVAVWQPATATADPVTLPGRHPTARVCPDNGRLLACFAIRQTDTVAPNVSANALPNGFGPADLRSAYNLTTTGSAAMAVAIVDAFDDPTAESDLATYRSTFGLPPCTADHGGSPATITEMASITTSAAVATRGGVAQIIEHMFDNGGRWRNRQGLGERNTAPAVTACL